MSAAGRRNPGLFFIDTLMTRGDAACKSLGIVTYPGDRHGRPPRFGNTAELTKIWSNDPMINDHTRPFQGFPSVVRVGWIKG